LIASNGVSLSGAVSNLLGAPIFAPSNAHAAAFAINNGSDIEMGSTFFFDSLMSAVEQNLTNETVITAAARRALYGHVRANSFQNFPPSLFSSLPAI
jgi:beta-glucosidase-like glycosyl hydrolase